MPETKMTSYFNRMKLTNEFAEMIIPFLQKHGFMFCNFGYEQILREEKSMKALIKKLKFKKSNAALMIKFSPDYICAFPKLQNDKGLFLVDAKATITPVFFHKHIERLRRRAKLPHLRREDIGEIEREAWDTYNRFYPKERVAIIMACPYHPRLIVAEWVSKTLCFYRMEKDVNIEAAGSGTPHVNIHLGKMRTLSTFLDEEFGVKTNSKLYRSIENKIKTWPLNKPAGRVNWTQFNNAITELRATCPWLKHRWPMGDESSLRLDSFTPHSQT
ncbi:MAG: hypothetical protein QXZ70_01015 [Candidatus Bathyarchaeia archaeon]